jgi:hypothetical protein
MSEVESGHIGACCEHVNVPKITFALLHVGGVITLLCLSTWTVLAQSAAVAPDHPWHTSAELSVAADAEIFLT